MTLVIQNLPLPARIRHETPMTDEELMRFCAMNEAVRVEREINGDLLVMTPAGNETSRINARVCRFMDEWAEADRRGVAFDSNGGFNLRDGSMRSPDAAWILKRRWDAMSSCDQERFTPICPDFVIEIRSKSDSLSQPQSKMAQWIANGAEVAWLIDPVRRVVEIYRPGEGAEELVEPTSVQGSGPVAGFELVMQRVWG
jgi:Uma2 family endonuclease